MSDDRGLTVWLTGLSGAGKSTLAAALAARLRAAGRPRVEILDGDQVRETLSAGSGFSKADRDQHIRRVAHVAQLLTRNGVVVIVAAISPYRELREFARRLIGDFVEVFVTAPLETLDATPRGSTRGCARGPSRTSRASRTPTSRPERPEVVCHTDREDLETCVDRIVTALGPLDNPSADREVVPSEEAAIRERLARLGYLS
jgi:adenylyl-sulfate kinase